MKAIVRENDEAVSPVIATILMVAITVVLAAVLYVMVSGLITNPNQNVTAWGVSLGTSGDGTNWTLQFTSIPQTTTQGNVKVTIVSGSGAPTAVANTLLSTIAAGTVPGTYYSPAAGAGATNAVTVGDTLRLSNSASFFPAGYAITITVGSSVVYQHTL